MYSPTPFTFNKLFTWYETKSTKFILVKSVQKTQWVGRPARHSNSSSCFHASLPNSRNIIVILLLLILSPLPKQPLFSVPPSPWCDCIQFQIAASIPSCWRPRSCHPIEQPGVVWYSSFAEEMWAAQQGPAKKEWETSHFPKFRNSWRSNQPT